MALIDCIDYQGLASEVLLTLGVTDVDLYGQLNSSTFLLAIHRQIQKKDNQTAPDYGLYTLDYFTRENKPASITIQYDLNNPQAWVVIFFRFEPELDPDPAPDPDPDLEPDLGNMYVRIIMRPEFIARTPGYQQLLNRKIYGGVHTKKLVKFDSYGIFEELRNSTLAAIFTPFLNADGSVNIGVLEQHREELNKSSLQAIFSDTDSLVPRQNSRSHSLFHLWGGHNQAFTFLGLGNVLSGKKSFSAGEAFDLDVPRSHFLESPEDVEKLVALYHKHFRGVDGNNYIQSDADGRTFLLAYKYGIHSHHILKAKHPQYKMREFPFGYLIDAETAAACCLFYDAKDPTLWYLVHVNNPSLRYNKREVHVWISPALWQASRDYAILLNLHSGLLIDRPKAIDRELLPQRVRPLINLLVTERGEVHLPRARLCSWLTVKHRVPIEQVVDSVSRCTSLSTQTAESTYEQLAERLFSSPSGSTALTDDEAESSPDDLERGRAVVMKPTVATEQNGLTATAATTRRRRSRSAP